MECPKEEDIILYRYNRLPFWKKILYRQHIKKCKRCAAVLEDIYKEDKLIAEMQNPDEPTEWTKFEIPFEPRNGKEFDYEKMNNFLKETKKITDHQQA